MKTNRRLQHGLSNKPIDRITSFLGSSWAIFIHLLFITLWMIIGYSKENLIFIISIEGVFIWFFVLHTTNKIRDFEWKRDMWERRRDREKLEHDVRITEKDLKITQEVYKTIQEMSTDIMEIKARVSTNLPAEIKHENNDPDHAPSSRSTLGGEAI